MYWYVDPGGRAGEGWVRHCRDLSASLPNEGHLQHEGHNGKETGSEFEGDCMNLWNNLEFGWRKVTTSDVAQVP